MHIFIQTKIVLHKVKIKTYDIFKVLTMQTLLSADMFISMIFILIKIKDQSHQI